MAAIESRLIDTLTEKWNDLKEQKILFFNPTYWDIHKEMIGSIQPHTYAIQSKTRNLVSSLSGFFYYDV